MKTSFLCLILFLFGSNLYSQNLFIYNIDTSTYPTVRASFFAFDSEWNQQNLNQMDVVLKENGLPRTVYSFNCPTPNKPLPISSVFMMDVSKSMVGDHLDVAKQCASAWVNILKNDKSECAINTFDHFNYFNQDFTTDKSKLYKAIDNLYIGNGTDYNKALNEPMCSGLRATKTGKFKKVLILITDGASEPINELSKIIDEAKLQKCKIFILAIDMKCPQDLKNIANQTGGLYFDNINEQTKKDELFRVIMHLAQGGEPCEVPWKSVAPCDTSDINVELSWSGVSSTLTFPVPKDGLHKINTRPSNFFLGVFKAPTVKDTIINLAVKAIDYKITAINLIYGSRAFEIMNVKYPITIPKNTNYNIPIRFTPTDSNYCVGEFEIVTDYCNATFSCSGGDRDKEMKNPTLKLTKPNGGEEFIMNVDTLIEWEGVVPSDTVNLEYSLNNGTSWKKITDQATNLKYIWKEIPNVKSSRCLIRVSQGCVDSIPKLIWQKTLGGSSSEDVSSFQQTKDGGYIIAGSTNSNDMDVTGNRGMADYWIVKLNAKGVIEWQKTFGGTGDDFAKSIMQTSDGGYVVAGTTGSSDRQVTGYQGNNDFWVVKLNSKGALVWQKSLGGSGDDSGTCVYQTLDGGYLVGGYSSSWDGDVNKTINGIVAWVARLDENGNLVWSKIIGSEADKVVSIKQSMDGGYILGVNHSVVSGMPPTFIPQYSLIKLNASGTTLWDRIFGGSNRDVITSAIETSDYGFIASGYTNSGDGDVTGLKGGYDCWIVKFNQSGNLVWQKTFGGVGDDYANSIYQINDGGYVIAGETNSKGGDVDFNHGKSDAWIAKLDPVGAIQWKKSFGGSEIDIAKSIIQTKERGFAFISTTHSTNGDITQQKGNGDYWITKLGTEKYTLQSDQSDEMFAIIPFTAESNDLNLQKCLLGEIKDTTISEIIKNTLTQRLRIDSIYFRGTDASAFSLVSAFPKYTLPIAGSHNSELRFKPTKVGVHKAEIVIITQADTVVQKIQGEGIQAHRELYHTLIDFGETIVGGEKDTNQVVIIKNLEQTNIDFTNIKINGPNQTDFIITNGGGTYRLEPDDVLKIDLKFKPSDVGRTSGLLELYYDGVGSPIQVQLYGKGTSGKSQDLISPLDDAINVPIDSKLVWKANTANSSYILQISTNENFTDFIVDTTLTDTIYNCSHLGNFQLYYWRVKSFIANEQSNWSPFWRFTTLMDTVKLISPADLTKNLATPVNALWGKSIYNKDYRLQTAEDYGFTNIKYDTLIHQATTADLKNLDYITNYFWRVRNESGDTLGYWSNIWQFKTGMSSFHLIYPENNQTGLELNINFKWSQAIGADYYQLQVSKNEQFTNMVYSKDSINTIEHYVPDLEPNILYYWRVRIWNEESVGSVIWSDVWNFKTNPAGVNDESKNIELIPNPASNFITVKMGAINPTLKSGVDESLEIQIYNTLGEKLMTIERTFLPVQQINIESLPKGVYFVKIGSETAKFVKM
jgi:uncharacterized protein YegL